LLYPGCRAETSLRSTQYVNGFDAAAVSKQLLDEHLAHVAGTSGDEHRTTGVPLAHTIVRHFIT